MLRFMSKLPGAPTPVETEPTNGYVASPFYEEIAKVTVPRQIRIPIWKTLHDGTSDPYRPRQRLQAAMRQIDIPWDLVEPVMCKSFGGTLDGAGLEWLMDITPGSISCLADLTNAFYQQFASSRQLEKQTSDIYQLFQSPTESVRDYFSRFNCEKISIKNCDVKTTIEAFKRGLVPNSKLYREITKYPCATFEEVRSRAIAQMRLEDDEATRTTAPRPTGAAAIDDHTPRGTTAGDINYTIAKTRNEWADHPDISEYSFNVDIGGVVNTLQNIGETVRWPRKSGIPDSMKDMSQWCEFHSDNGHKIEECISLKKEVAYLLKRGHLQELLSDKGKETYNRAKTTQPNPTSSSDRPAPPKFNKVVNVIYGGSDIYGLTSPAAKNIIIGESGAIKEGHTENEITLDKSLAAMSITFDDSDSVDAHPEHHDGLVISLPIGNALIKRILIDNISSKNVFFLEALQEMGLEEKNIVKRSPILVRFSRLRTVGEI
ncbi:uncharacterized protein [Spinacia oleracea]|uniref:Retrotransposon gag domain-containing protein n=1 Tax=Spinacia oleracea TaxID=3562 RepID=A0ABM3QQI6_SPIOL|nr:uncharacterized protein LOC130461501 [Spinacia oleracea]